MAIFDEFPTLMAVIREYKKTIILCGLVAIFTAPTHGGFMLLFVVPVFAIWLVYSIFVIWCKPERRRLQIGRLVIWIVVLVSIGCTHWYSATTARRDAEQVTETLFRYKAQHGAFPSNLSQVGIDARSLKKEWMLHYSITNGKPVLSYATTFTPFETYSYDFYKRAWHYNPD